MVFTRKKQEIKRATIRFFEFVVSLISRGAPAPTAPMTEPSPAFARSAVEQPCVNLAGMSLEEMTAALDALDVANDTSGAAKSPTKSRIENVDKCQEAPASSADEAACCPVGITPHLTPSTSTLPTPAPSNRPLTLAQRLRARQPSPLAHLFGTAAKPFILSTITPTCTWSRSTSADKFAVAIRSSQSRKGVAITLNLSQAREKALRTAADPVELLSTYIARAMRASLGQVLPYAFQFEISPVGRLHAHGVVCLDKANQIELDALKSALATAGGKIKGRAGSRQVKLTELYSADGWTAYFAKTASGTAKDLGTDRINFVSSGLRRLAETDWTDAYDRAHSPLAAAA